jgi:hypothetical protein
MKGWWLYAKMQARAPKPIWKGRKLETDVTKDVAANRKKAKDANVRLSSLAQSGKPLDEAEKKARRRAFDRRFQEMLERRGPLLPPM